MEETVPLVYIIILNYNGKKDSEECLDSVRDLDYGNFKVLVVDNGSQDGSVQYLRNRFPWVEFKENRSNLGFAAGNNEGIKCALEKGADFIFILNNDTIVTKTLLQELMAVMSKDASVGIAGPKILYYYQKDKIWFAGGRISLLLGNSWHIGNREKDSQRYQKVIAQDYQTGCALLIRRGVVDKVGLFDCEYFAYFEDADLCLRAKRKKFNVVCIQNAKIWHKISSTSGGGLTARKAYLKAKSGVRFFRKYSPRLAYYTTVPFCALCYIILVSLYHVFKGREGLFTSFISGLVSGIRQGGDNDHAY